jgi:Flp pilus assembly protein TadD
MIKPNDPSVLSNLGLSYALTNDLKKAEDTLRLATAQPGAAAKVKQNLALVVAMEGRVPEAESIARYGVPPAQGDANVAYLRSTLAQYKQKQSAPPGAS